MTKDKKEKIGKILTSSIETAKEDLTKLLNLTKPIAPDNAIGRLSRMEAIGEKSINERAAKNVKNKIEQLEEAIRRLERDEYGECLLCEEEISEARLKVMPESAICLECARARE